MASSLSATADVSAAEMQTHKFKYWQIQRDYFF